MKPNRVSSRSTVGELSVASPLFRTLWARHDIADRGSGAVTLDHPQVGELRLDRDKLAVSGTDGIMLVIYQPHPNSDATDKLALLASTSAPRPLADTQQS